MTRASDSHKEGNRTTSKGTFNSDSHRSKSPVTRGGEGGQAEASGFKRPTPTHLVCAGRNSGISPHFRCCRYKQIPLFSTARRSFRRREFVARFSTTYVNRHGTTTHSLVIFISTYLGRCVCVCPIYLVLNNSHRMFGLLLALRRPPPPLLHTHTRQKNNDGLSGVMRTR